MTRHHEGDLVRTSVDDPHLHVRLPRYARGRVGTVVALRGPMPVPSLAAQGVPDPPREPVYTVRFDGVELWGVSAETQTSVLLEIWEHHLSPLEAQ